MLSTPRTIPRVLVRTTTGTQSLRGAQRRNNSKLLSLKTLSSNQQNQEQRRNDANQGPEQSLTMALAIKDKVAGKLAREFRVTLHNMLCITDGVLDCWDAISDSKKKEALHYILDSRDQLMLLFCNLEDLSNFRNGSFKLQFQSHDIKALIINIVDEFKCLSGAITLHIAGGINTQIYCDENRIKQVVRNLITNAIRYAGADKNIEISVSSFQDKKQQYLKVAVADEGQGIPVGSIETIFDHSYHDTQNKHKPGGADMGIAVCKDIILDHKGKIWAENNKKGGATFHFILPYNKIRG